MLKSYVYISVCDLAGGCPLTGVQQSQGPNAESYVVSSDEDDVTPNVISAAVMSSYHKSRYFNMYLLLI